MKKLFFDFDGTIADFSDRYYCIYREFLTKYGQKSLSRKAYLTFKKNRVPEEEILEKTIKQSNLVKKIAEKRLQVIEDNYYLNYDKLVPGAKETIGKLARNFELYIVTNRKIKSNFLSEVKRLKIGHFFDDFITCSDNNEEPYIQKAKAILNKSANKDDFIVGDTEDDIKAGKYAKIPVIAVLSGIRTKKFIQDLNPDYIIKDINQIFSIIRRSKI